MAWRRSGDKPLSEPMIVSLLTHVCITRPQWVKKHLSNHYKTWHLNTHSHAYYLIWFWRNSVSLAFFFFFFKVKHSVGHISGKCLVRFTWNVTLAFTSPMIFPLNFSRSYFKNSSFRIAQCQELFVWLMWNKKEANQLDTGPTTV